MYFAIVLEYWKVQPRWKQYTVYAMKPHNNTKASRYKNILHITQNRQKLNLYKGVSSSQIFPTRTICKVLICTGYDVHLAKTSTRVAENQSTILE